jgi:GNAT superfamily N-acetyltransferase
VAAWLIDSQEVDELAVRPRFQGIGVGAALLEVLTGFSGRAGSWLVTSTRSPHTVPFYRSRGWSPVTRVTTVPSTVVLVSPAHPCRDAAPKAAGEPA